MQNRFRTTTLPPPAHEDDAPTLRGSPTGDPARPDAQGRRTAPRRLLAWLGRHRPAHHLPPAAEPSNPPVIGRPENDPSDVETLRRSLAALAAAHEQLLGSVAVRRPREGGPINRVLFGIGEWNTPGASLRSRAQLAVCGRAGIEARALPLPDIGPEDILAVDCLVLWRTPWSEHVATMISLVQRGGGLVAFDADDLFFDPELADGSTIDGIRSLGFDRAEIARLFGAMRRTAAAADFCLATTEPLAAALRRVCRRVHVLPNGFDDLMLEAMRRASSPSSEEPVRIGYALGTRTHQRDFAAAAPALAAVLRARPETRLVLFRDRGIELLDLAEFPAFATLRRQIEWRDLVPFDRLPDEIGRFAIAVCPLETGNPFVECKSEIKFVEAALLGIPVVASPTEPFRRAIRHGETGFLVGSDTEWRDALLALVDDAALRARIGRAAASAVLWTHGPKRRAELLSSIFRSQAGGAAGAREAELAIRRGDYVADRPIALPPTVILFDGGNGDATDVAVAVTSRNYRRFLGDALASVAAQTLRPLELVVIDDGSTDGSPAALLDWAKRNGQRFGRIRIEQTTRNSGLGPARNAAFAAARAPYVMSLDADNLLGPSCCETLLGLMIRADCAFAYSPIEQFGEGGAVLGTLPFDPARLVPSNYIDAMAMVARWAWSAAGGYYDDPFARGWEDYDLWCRLAELGQFGVWHPEPLCRYRVHDGSMTNGTTERVWNKDALIRRFERNHPWLRLESRTAVPRGGVPD